MLQGEVLYRFARCRQPLSMRLMWNQGLPLPESQLEVVEPALKWEQLRVSLPSEFTLVPSQPCLSNHVSASVRRPSFERQLDLGNTDKDSCG